MQTHWKGLEVNQTGASPIAVLIAVIGLLTAGLGLAEALYRTGIVTGQSPIQRVTSDSTSVAGDNPSVADDNHTPTQAPSDLSFLQIVAGEWRLESWTETPSSTTLYLAVLAGELSIESTGSASWSMDIQEVNELATPQPGLRCGGELRFSTTQIEGVPGGDRNEQIDWTPDMSSISENILLALCGWNSAGEHHPFDLSFEASPGEPALFLEMRNSKGTFVWTRG